MGRSNQVLGLLLLLTIGGFAASLYTGSTSLPVMKVLAGRDVDAVDRVMVLDIRLPRAVTALIVGGCLALAGVIFQGLFRNPLADPFVVGTSGGAALGAVAAGLIIPGATWIGVSASHLAALAGSLATSAIVLSLSRRSGRISLQSLLLCGFVVGTFAASMVTILLLLHTRNWNEVLQWLMGHLSLSSWARIRMGLPWAVIAFGIAVWYARDLNLLLFGEETAQHLGSDVERAKRALLIAGALATAAAVSMAGIIGFVGLLVPHVLRGVLGSDHRNLLPSAFLGGGVVLLFSDIVARWVWPPVGLPVGAVTAMLGPPFFLWLLRR